MGLFNFRLTAKTLLSKTGIRKNIITGTIFKSAYATGIALFLFAITQLLLTLILHVSPEASLFDVYSRNFSSVICYAIVAFFMVYWSYFNVGSLTTYKSNMTFRNLTITATIASLVRGCLSLYYTISQAPRGIYVITYYATDTIAWLMLFLFFYAYLNTKLSFHNHHSDIKAFKTLVILLVIACFAKASASVLYTMLNYVPSTYPWLYYLVDVIAWFLLCMFFATYANSDLIKHSLFREKRTDTELMKKMEQAGKQ